MNSGPYLNTNMTSSENYNSGPLDDALRPTGEIVLNKEGLQRN